MFNWLKKHKIMVSIVSFVIVLGVPLAIHFAFKIDAVNSLFEAEWTAGELLGYYGSILSFIGTVVLGALALYQNRLIKDESDKIEKRFEQREHERNMPKFVVVSTGSDGQCSHLRFDIQNISENIANTVELYDICILSPDSTLRWESTKKHYFAIIPPLDKITVTLNNPVLNEDGDVFSIKMKCCDKYNESHNYKICGIYHIKNHYPNLTIVET